MGDSFTYGDELADPAKSAWPVLLAEKMGYDLVNEGKPGAGNEYIVKKTIKSVPRYNPDLVIVSWTSASRQEFSDEWGTYDIWPGQTLRYPINHRGKVLKHREELIKYITMYNNEEHEYRRWLRQVILLQSYLKCYNVNYRFVSAFDCQYRTQKYNEQEYWNLIDTENFIGWPDRGLVEWAWPSQRGPGGHPLEQGHQKIAQEIVKHI